MLFVEVATGSESSHCIDNSNGKKNDDVLKRTNK